LGIENENRQAHGKTHIAKKVGRIISLVRLGHRIKNAPTAKCSQRMIKMPKEMLRNAQIPGVLAAGDRFLNAGHFIIEKI
jgi:hypothetical protein